MRFAERFKTTIYVAPINRSSRPVTYGTPVRYKVNVLPTKAYADIQLYGVGYNSILKIVCDKKYSENIKELDAVYVDVKPPNTQDNFAETADYFVTNVKRGMSNTVITLQLRVLENG